MNDREQSIMKNNPSSSAASKKRRIEEAATAGSMEEDRMSQSSAASSEKKRRIEEAGAIADSMEEDRLSQLPGHVLDHIISLLPQEDAVRTCILSKSWRHLGPTRPKIEFHESSYPEKEQQQKFVKNTLQRYLDQKLPIREFISVMSLAYEYSHRLLNKWIPIVLLNMGVKTFNLTAHNFSPPPVVFESEVLEELYLKSCKLNQIINVKLHMLKRLSLDNIYIEDSTFEKIMSSCPLIEHLVLRLCNGLSNVQVSNARNLKHFYCSAWGIDSIEINDDAPSLETIRIEGNIFRTWYHHKNYFFPRLKSLYLQQVDLTTESFDNLSSNNCPCLEELLLFCSGSTEFLLSNRSIKRLIFQTSNDPIKAACFDVANILYFEFRSQNYDLPSIFSFATNSREWKSRIRLWCPSDSNPHVLSTWYLKLKEFLKAISQSQISMKISNIPLMYQGTFDGGSCEPVVVEQLFFGEYLWSKTIPGLLDFVFRICRPRYIGVPSKRQKTSLSRLHAEYMWTTLKGETKESKFWKQDLEETSIQVLDENTNEWRSVKVCSFPNDENIRFRLKWRDSSEVALVH